MINNIDIKGIISCRSLFSPHPLWIGCLYLNMGYFMLELALDDLVTL